MWVHIAQRASSMHTTRVRGLDRGQRTEQGTDRVYSHHTRSLVYSHHARSLVYSHHRALHKANRKESKSVARLR